MMSMLRVSLAFPLVAQTCVTDSDCSLLGDCVDSVCQCDPGWKGPRCGQVDMLPVKRSWGYRNSSMASWCGSATKVEDEYHYFGSGISGNCSLPQFATNSMSVRATSKSPMGPYKFEQVALPEFSHSTSVTRDVDGSFLLFTIGKDMGGENVHTCTGEGPWPPSRGDSDHIHLGPHDYMRISKATKQTGPWETRVIMQSEPSKPSAWNCNKSNPSGLVLSNGSILMMYRGTLCVVDKSCRKGPINTCEHQGIAFAENSSAPFVDRQGEIKELAGNEDAFLWQSKRGFHALFHSKNVCESYGESKQCGSLAYSVDSWHWTLNEDAAYNASLTWQEQDGSFTTDKLLSRQRPNILFDEDGKTPLMLINGALDSTSFKEYSLFVPFNVPANLKKTVVV